MRFGHKEAIRKKKTISGHLPVVSKNPNNSFSKNLVQIKLQENKARSGDCPIRQVAGHGIQRKL
jgi:hypothetical protein